MRHGLVIRDASESTEHFLRTFSSKACEGSQEELGSVEPLACNPESITEAEHPLVNSGVGHSTRLSQSTAYPRCAVHGQATIASASLVGRSHPAWIGGAKKAHIPLSPRTVRYIHTIISCALRDAKKQRLVKVNVAHEADPPTAKIAKEAAPEMRTWSAAELNRFLNSSRGDRYEPVWTFLATTGMRRGEALGLRWSDLKLDASPATATIRRAAIVIGHRREAGKTRTGKDRLIELDAHTVNALRAWKARQAQERLLVGAGYQSNERSDLHAARWAWIPS